MGGKSVPDLDPDPDPVSDFDPDPDSGPGGKQSCCENVFWCSILWVQNLGVGKPPRRLLSFVFIGYQGHPYPSSPGLFL